MGNDASAVTMVTQHLINFHFVDNITWCDQIRTAVAYSDMVTCYALHQNVCLGKSSVENDSICVWSLQSGAVLVFAVSF